MTMSIVKKIISSLKRFLGYGVSEDVKSAVESGGISGPYRPEDLSIYSLARRDSGKIASLIIAEACDGDRWTRTNLRSVVSIELAERLGEVVNDESSQ
jgi:hypothetical protein